jgi:hypothetical protein
MPDERERAESMNDADRDLELALRTLSPSRSSTATIVDPIAAAFAAGQRSSRRALRLWQSATAAAVVIAGGVLLTSPSIRPAFPVVPSDSRVVVATSPPPIEPSAAPSDQSLIMLWQAVRERGVDRLPVSRFAPSPTSVRRANDSL